MLRKTIAVAAVAAAIPTTGALAHAVCGARIFPVTLTLDDPGVADEASLPTFTWNRTGATDSAGPGYQYGFGLEYDKRITENLGVAVNTGWNVQTAQGAKTQTGWDNIVATLKYARCVSPEHEFQLAVGVAYEFGGSGTASTGASPTSATTPTLYFGKGFGDLPIGPLRALAVTGELSYTIASRSLKATTVTDPDTGLMSLQYNNGNPNTWFGGFSVQYSIPYLQSQVKHYDLPEFVGRLTPIVEVTWASTATSPTTQPTTWTIAPGVLYTGDSYQVGVEALIPGNKASGSNVGVIAQLHFFLDDIFPNTLGKPISEWFK